MSEKMEQLQKEIQALIPELNLEASDDKIQISDFGLKDLRVEVDNRIIFRFYKVAELNPGDVALYLQTRMDFTRISQKFIKEDSFYLYPNDSFKSNSKGEFEKRMYVLRTLKDAHEALIELKNELNLNKK